MSARAAIWLNAVLFELAWLASVYGAARDACWIGPLAVCAFAAYQIPAGRHARADLTLVVIAFGVGCIVDTLFARTGFVIYAAPIPSPAFAPIWIVALWVNLALTLNHAMRFLQRQLVLAALLGAIGGPLSYFFASRTWHAVTLAEPVWRTVLALAIAWGVLMPLLVWIARRLRGEPALEIGTAHGMSP